MPDKLASTNIIKDALNAAAPGSASSLPGRDALSQSAQELEALAARHRRLVEELKAPQTGLDVRATCACRSEFRETLLECIEVLEETRQAFKSRRLALLRRKLIQKLSDHA